MSKGSKIWEAARDALRSLGGSGTLEQIFSSIAELNLYSFRTKDPREAIHILETEIKRKSLNSIRMDHSGVEVFEMIGHGIYSLIKDRTEMNERKASGTKRIYRSKDKEKIIALLMDAQVGIFSEIWRLLLFSAQVGFHHKKRVPLLSIDSGRGIDQTTFGNCPSWPGVCYMIALVEETSAEMLSGDASSADRRISIFQEYANGGLSILEDYFRNRSVDLDGILNFIDEHSIKGLEEANLSFGL